MSMLDGVRGRSTVAGELFRFLWRRRLWWMMPVVAVLMLVGVLLIAGQNPVLAPFIYTLF
jgi:hypothetical protein